MTDHAPTYADALFPDCGCSGTVLYWNGTDSFSCQNCNNNWPNDR